MTALTRKQADRPISLLLPALLAASLAAALSFQLGAFRAAPADAVLFRPELVTLPAGRFLHRLDGEYYRNGYAVDAPKVELVQAEPLEIMKFQVTARDYDACVADGVCHPREPGKQPQPALGEDVPATGVSYDDAIAYARWLSDRTGELYSLPSDAEWAYAAGEKFVDDALGIDPESRNPALRWLADYNRETARKAAVDPTPKPLGHYGANAAGVADIAGNVWEWTSTCQRRVDLSAAARGKAVDSICGIYVAEGRHRTAISSFVREPKTGGCSVGAPPDNLGFRLVRRPDFLERVKMGIYRWLPGSEADTGNP
ncbi:SUMF1/EgtB/PvdO family nonheme iron enzyme [Gellertiella hungarica]|uniref:Formylglycine-generating enzyme required for sulfatase activity n=1 Tax=Gellertiella hungarica TaxID=1572859 RepID=A0A7W6J5Z4_9HYPH|nr:SUMF1/EgtB/PvdO family nonheme iron enzyme [Gellertiella hungarica]MBB4065384.1 formylglycine-generating enzyme required for sulfatase activity [Gellertiella hungarica]